MNRPNQDSACQPNWSAYYDAVEGRPPRETLLQALARFDAEVSTEGNTEVSTEGSTEVGTEVSTEVGTEVGTATYTRSSTEISREINARTSAGTSLISDITAIDITAIATQSRFAVDLGCGDGRDSAELLQRGWRVLAVDAEPEAIARLHDRFSNLLGDRLAIQQARFEALQLPPAVDLINASFCLPFCPPEKFPKLWQTIIDSLRVGGRLCGQLFGDRDSWSTHSNMTFYTRGQLELLLRPFAIEFLEEEEHSGQTALGEDKYWHIFHLVARKLR